MSFEVTPLDEHNLKLLENVKPDTWQNPEPRNPYNLVVIGAGTAGLISAAGAAGLGARVALIERAFMGGDCLNYGCVPSKGIIRCATALADVKDSEHYGITGGDTAQVDFGKVMERMRRLRAQISHADSVHRFKDLGIDVFLGEGQFTGPRSVDVEGQSLTFSRAVIATGARASAPPIPGLENVEYLNNESIFNLTEQPRRLTVIGGGPIGCEMAQTFQRFGTDVTLLELADHILIKEDADTAEIVQQQLVKDGVTLALHAERIIQIEEKNGEKHVRYFCRKTQGECTVVSDAILVAVGRAPNVHGMGLEEAGVEFDPRRGIKVNDHLRTSNARIFAAGDVCSRYQFTHTADFLARIVLNNAFFDLRINRKKASALIIPWCTYSDPQIAHVGITERQAREQGIAIETFKQPLDEVDRAILDGETEGLVKIHVAKGSDRILGGTVVARHAGDMIGEVVMAMQHEIGLGAIANIIHPYPTQAEAIRKTGDLYNRTRLTPKVKRWMARWMNWRRTR